MSETTDGLSDEERDYQEIRDAILEAGTKGEFEIAASKDSIGTKAVINGNGDPDMKITYISGVDVETGRAYVDNLWGSGIIDVPMSVLWALTPMVERVNEIRESQVARATDEFMKGLASQISKN